MTAIAANRNQFLIPALMGSIVMLAWFISGARGNSALVVAIGIVASVLAFFWTEIAIYFLIFAMLLSPELEAGTTSGATLGRAVTFRIDDFLIVLISMTWFIRSVLYKELDLIARTPLNGAIFFYVVSCVIPTLSGVLDGRVELASGSLFLLKYVEYFIIFWMVVNTTRDETQVARFLIALFIVAILVSFNALAQIPSGHRVSAPFEGEKTGEPNTFGGYLLFMISLLWGIALSTPRFRKTVVLVSMVLFIPFLYTLSRASYLGLLPAALALPLLTRRYYILAGALSAALLVLAFPSLLPTAVKNRIEFTYNKAPNKGQVRVLGRRVDTSTSARIVMFQASANAFLERPFIGFGVTGWRFVDSQYIRSLTETGLLGMTALLYLLFRIYRIATQTRLYFDNKNDLYFGLSSGFVAGLIGLIFHAVGSNTFIIIRIMEPFWLVCALVLVLPHLAEGSQLALRRPAQA